MQPELSQSSGQTLVSCHSFSNPVLWALRFRASASKKVLGLLFVAKHHELLAVRPYEFRSVTSRISPRRSLCRVRRTSVQRDPRTPGPHGLEVEDAKLRYGVIRNNETMYIKY